MVPRPFLRNTLRLSVADAARLSVADAALLCAVVALPSFALAQDSAHDPANYAWQAGAMRHAQKMRAYFDADRGEQPTPPLIPKFEIDFDPAGLIATVQPRGPTVTSQNAFLPNLRTNRPTCLNCPPPQNRCGLS